METVTINKYSLIFNDVKAILACRSKDKNRPNLTGILIEASNANDLSLNKFVCTDGYTLGIFETSNSSYAPGYYQVVAENKQTIVLQLDNDVTFPDYKSIIETNPDREFKEVVCRSNKNGAEFSEFACQVIRMLDSKYAVNLTFLEKVFIPGETYQVSTKDAEPIVFKNSNKTFLVMPMRS